MPICIEFEGDCIGWVVSSIALLFGGIVGVGKVVFGCVVVKGMVKGWGVREFCKGLFGG